MEKFSLEKYLENPNRKVVTRDGRPVRIICWDRQCELEYNYPVIALVSVEHTEVPVISNKEGKTWNNNEINSLFFADEEEELNEFEKHVQAVMMNCGLVGCTKSYKNIDVVKATSKHLLDLARKELKEDWRTPLRFYKRAYEQGKKDALKNLPKWKDSWSTSNSTKPQIIGGYLIVGDNLIHISDLVNKLPKEE